MRKAAILSAVVAFVAAWPLGCDEVASTGPEQDVSQPVLAQGGANLGPYTAQELPFLPGTDECWGNDITSNGTVVGACTTYVCCDADCELEWTQAVIWKKGAHIVLPSLGGCTANAGQINNRGWVVGTARAPDGRAHGVLWTDHQTIVDLGNPEGGNTYGAGLNNRGQVALTSCSDPWSCRGILWEDGAYIDMGDLGGGTTTINAINDRGQVVGSSIRADGQYRAYLWQNGQMRDLGTLGGDYSRAFGINNRGQVVGEARVSTSDMHAFVWGRGEMTDLGIAGAYFSRAHDISDAGIIVGHSSVIGAGPDAAVWHGGGVTYIESGPYSVARAINSRGQILGQAWRDDSGQGTYYAVVVWDR